MIPNGQVNRPARFGGAAGISGPFSDVRWLPCKNANAGVIPQYSAVRVTGADNRGVLTVDQPNTDGQDVMITREASIPAGGYGLCTMDWPTNAAYNAGDGTPAVGDTWGAGNGSWNLRKAKAGFAIIGGVNAGNVVVYRAGSAASSVPFSGAALGPNNSGMTTTQLSNVDFTQKIYDTDGYAVDGGGHPSTRLLTISKTGWYRIGARFECTPKSGLNTAMPGGVVVLPAQFQVLLNSNLKGFGFFSNFGMTSWYATAPIGSELDVTIHAETPPLLCAAPDSFNAGLNPLTLPFAALPLCFWIEKVG